MSTNARLRAVYSSGKSLKPIYVHWDGYPSYMLPILKDNYNTEEKVEELLSLGNLSVLQKRAKPDTGELHTFQNPVPNVTIAYHRDRGEDLSFSFDRQQYNYVFDGETWKLE